MSGPNETRIQSWILVQLKERYPDSLFDRQNVIAAEGATRFIRSGTPGQGDIRGCHKGRYIELEVKRPGKGQSKKQKERQADVTRAGGIYAVVNDKHDAFAVVDAL